MKHNVLHSLTVLLLGFIMLVSCNRKGPHMIPRDTMAELYSELFLLDQWIQSTPGERLVADTSLVYEPILKKYGYTKEDYMHTVDHYLDDPERYSEVLDKTIEIYDKRLKTLNEQREHDQEAEKERKRIAAIKRDTRIDISHFNVMNYSGDRRYFFKDTLMVSWDSISKFHRFSVAHYVDTVKVVDTLVISDSLQMSGKVSVSDSLHLNDSLVQKALTGKKLKIKL